MLGYHFVGETLRDGRPIPPNGEWLGYDGPVVPCESGLHMSEHPFDALKYAPGATLCLVELDGDIVAHGTPEHDKHVGRRRRILVRADATTMLRRFAADQALSVAHLWDMPEVVRGYLTTLDDSKRYAAWYAARDAAWYAARDAAWDAALDAALDAARYAARAAARAAAWSASLDAALDASLDAARASARAAAWSASRDVEAWYASRAASRAAALDAALDAAWTAAVRIEFKSRVDALLKKKVTV